MYDTSMNLASLDIVPQNPVPIAPATTISCRMFAMVIDPVIANQIVPTAGVTMYVRMPRACLLYTSPSPRDYAASRMPSSA